MSSLCDATFRHVMDAWLAMDDAVLGHFHPSREEFKAIWKHYEEVERDKVKENQKRNIMEEGYNDKI
uniref:Uncharacterized protein n=1 Tax=viral metagenome TaxID=1070528 RepID=A0A6M3LK19_9ZZZZ